MNVERTAPELKPGRFCFLAPKTLKGRPRAEEITANHSPLFCQLILLFLLCAVFFSGCTRHSTKSELVIINGPEPETIDPGVLTSQGDGRIGLALFEGLTRYNPTNAAPVPGLAERWELADQDRSYTFHLRQNARWSTGEPITAHDFVYSWFRVLDPTTGAANASHMFYIRGAQDYHHQRMKDRDAVGVKAIDNHTLRVELAAPTPFFLDLCAYPTFAIVPRQIIEKHGDRWLMQRPLPVSGAYQLDHWRLNDKIRLRKNPLYWDAANTRTETVDLIPCSSGTTALNLYSTGKADIVWDKELIPSELLDTVRERPDFHNFDYLATYFIRFNVTKPPFNDPRVRRALALAVDKQRIVDRITRANESIASHQVPPGVAHYQSPRGLGHDPKAANRLLAEAGYPQGKGFPTFRFLYNTHKSHEKIAVELQTMWRDTLGITLEPQPIEVKVFYSEQNRLNYDLSRSSWVGDYNDANTFLDMFTSENVNNRTGWKNARYDKLIHDANAELDLNQRAGLLQAAETILVEEELPIIPLYFYVGLEYYDSTKIAGIFPNMLAEHPLRAIGRKKP